MEAVALTLMLLNAAAVPQTPAKPDRFEAFQFFLGSWEGTGQGKPGKSRMNREYTPILDGRFIEVRNRSVYAPQEGNPGEDHRDVGYLSFDSNRKKHVLRQFHVEGFVIRYIHDSTSDDGKTLIFVSEAIENIPPGWRARETYILAGPDELVERFELSEPGKDFELYSEARLRRVSR